MTDRAELCRSVLEGLAAIARLTTMRDELRAIGAAFCAHHIAIEIRLRRGGVHQLAEMLGYGFVLFADVERLAREELGLAPGAPLPRRRRARARSTSWQRAMATGAGEGSAA